MWFDKNDNRATFADCRKEKLDVSHCNTNPGKKEINPDIIHDFRNMNFDKMDLLKTNSKL